MRRMQREAQWMPGEGGGIAPVPGLLCAPPTWQTPGEAGDLPYSHRGPLHVPVPRVLLPPGAGKPGHVHAPPGPA